MKHMQPTFGLASFSCPHCSAVAHQDWYNLRAALRNRANAKEFMPEIHDLAGQADQAEPGIFALPAIGPAGVRNEFDSWVGAIVISRCFSCKRLAIWTSKKLRWPESAKAHWPNEDLSPEVKRDFEEAESIHLASPRGAAALLRLAIQKLCAEIEPDARDLNDAIGRMVKKGLNVQLQQALDVVRVIGNNAVHPGTIDLKDDAAAVSRLFSLVNLVADAMITQPKKIAEMYADLPPGALKGISDRDG